MDPQRNQIGQLPLRLHDRILIVYRITIILKSPLKDHQHKIRCNLNLSLEIRVLINKKIPIHGARHNIKIKFPKKYMKKIIKNKPSKNNNPNQKKNQITTRSSKQFHKTVNLSSQHKNKYNLKTSSVQAARCVQPKR
jgi:hypothetical protein